MKKLFSDTRILDRACRENYGLSEDLMMENAAEALKQAIFCAARAKNLENPTVIIFAGGGNNGGDGYALGRKIQGILETFIYCVNEPVSEQCKIQAKRAKKAKIPFLTDEMLEEKTKKIAIFVDCIYGSGFHGCFEQKIAELIEKINGCGGIKIACDIPSGIDSKGQIESSGSDGKELAFKADFTVCMGALKSAFYSDFAKDFCGKISCADLGISRELFENSVCGEDGLEPEAFLLEASDLILPERKKQNANKGSFGHVAVILGEKPGAAVISGKAAFGFGAGLVTLVAANSAANGAENRFLQVPCPAELMQGSELPDNVKAVAVGMGLGLFSCGAERFLKNFFDFQTREKYIPTVFDADMFYSKYLVQFLEKFAVDKNMSVLTPHPKEFASLLEMTGFGEVSVKEIVKNRIALSKKFVENYPNVVLLLKGANVCITCKNSAGKIETFINPLGDCCIAKGGSGDVLSGMIAALLAQGFSAFEAAKNASLAHALASQKMHGSYAVTPFSLIEKVAGLSEFDESEEYEKFAGKQGN